MNSVTRTVQDKVSQNVGGRSMVFDCEGPVNAITTNKDSSLVVAAGRTVFRILSIEDGHFEERLNLRVGKAKNSNLNYSAADVAWNHQDENILASAATNGSVVIWDLNRPTRLKQEHVFADHKRSVNRVNFHSGEHQLLISGSQDGNVILFDVRKKSVSSRFVAKGSESVRDVQFCPNSYFTFGATYDNGNVQIWDMRRPDRYESVFTAHSGPVFSHDWHPEDKNWMATAGRDKLIRVWDISRMPAKLMFNIQTIASVARVKWRPQRRYHLASCSLLLDHDVNIWNLHRPYIPFASFDEHKDVTTGIVWRDDNHFFLSCSKDGHVIQHMFKDAKRPADNVVPSGIDINITGEISHAYYDKPESSAKSGQTTRLFFRKQPDRSEQFTQISSHMFLFSEEESLSMRWFVQAALGYRVTGGSVTELCDWNMKVARSIGLSSVVQMWGMLKVMFGAATQSIIHVAKLVQSSGDKQDTEKGSLKQTGASKPLAKSNSEMIGDSDIEKTATEMTSGNSDDSSDSESSEPREMTDIASGLASKHTGDFFFGDGEQDVLGFSIDYVSRLEKPEKDWTLPSEAFQPRHEISDRTTPPEQMESRHDSLISSGNATDIITRTVPSESEEQDFLLSVSKIPNMSALNAKNDVAQLLRDFAEQGDVQTPVSVLLVLGDRVTSIIDEQTQENWFHCYIEMLGRYKLWSKANEVIKLSHLPAVKYLNQESTTINNLCAKCNRGLQRNRWLCERCRLAANLCSICHHQVKGLFAWCQGCCHGGHLQHMKQWLETSKYCPTGCGHRCEYS
ncbi:GATOR2 complex protein WDR24-like isoform X1 [Haliotis cracherodii]|uniref:GATOR2 complex protein WDR24-like isoform X1 n=1 Tax=Haliotis cracherodii TaxID=6455 RepID=UPI0039EAE2E4